MHDMTFSDLRKRRYFLLTFVTIGDIMDTMSRFGRAVNILIETLLCFDNHQHLPETLSGLLSPFSLCLISETLHARLVLYFDGHRETSQLSASFRPLCARLAHELGSVSCFTGSHAYSEVISACSDEHQRFLETLPGYLSRKRRCLMLKDHNEFASPRRKANPSISCRRISHMLESMP